MLTLKEFLKIFRDTAFEQTELTNFHRSVRKSAILLLLGKRKLTEVFHQEENYQWPILREIDNPGLTLYRNADKTLLAEFIKTIENEKILREQKKHMERVKYWNSLLEILEKRAELFRSIFNFGKKDETHLEAVAERYKRIVGRRAKKRNTAWGIGLGAGTAAGAAALWYITKGKEQRAKGKE